MKKVYEDMPSVDTYTGLIEALKQFKGVRIVISFRSENHGHVVEAELRRQLFRDSKESGLPPLSVTFDGLEATGQTTTLGTKTFWYSFSLAEANNQRLAEQAKLTKFKEEEL